MSNATSQDYKGKQQSRKSPAEHAQEFSAHLEYDIVLLAESARKASLAELSANNKTLGLIHLLVEKVKMLEKEVAGLKRITKQTT